MKDSLLAENPPWMLGAAILLIAALLVMAAVAARNIEYQETIPVSLVLRADEISGSAYGEGLLSQSQAAKVKPDQPIFMELASPSSADNILIEGQVSQVTMTCQDSLYQVRVKLPANFNSDQENTRILRQEARVQGRIITWRGKLFRRMFTLFSNL
ncbi:MAG TPA: hypothetical protein VI260_28005 [Blastocatellia bacterium]